MNILGEDMTIKNFNRHIYIGSHPEMSDDPRYFYKEHDQRQYFVDFCRDYLEYENLAKNSIKDINIALNSVEASDILNTFADLTPKKIRAYHAWLHKQNNKFANKTTSQTKLFTTITKRLLNTFVSCISKR